MAPTADTTARMDMGFAGAVTAIGIAEGLTLNAPLALAVSRGIYGVGMLGSGLLIENNYDHAGPLAGIGVSALLARNLLYSRSAFPLLLGGVGVYAMAFNAARLLHVLRMDLGERVPYLSTESREQAEFQPKPLYAQNLQRQQQPLFQQNRQQQQQPLLLQNQQQNQLNQQNQLQQQQPQQQQQNRQQQSTLLQNQQQSQQQQRNQLNNKQSTPEEQQQIRNLREQQQQQSQLNDNTIMGKLRDQLALHSEQHPHRPFNAQYATA